MTAMEGSLSPKVWFGSKGELVKILARRNRGPAVVLLKKFAIHGIIKAV